MREQSTSVSKWLTARNAGVALAVLAFAVIVIGVALTFQKNRQQRQFRVQVTQEDPEVVLRAVDDWRARGWLEDGSLQGAPLSEVLMYEIDISGADLWGAALIRAQFMDANLSNVNLARADLKEAFLQRAELSGANLQGASLVDTDLSGARGLTDAQLSQVSTLMGTTMPDGTRYDGRYGLPAEINVARGEDIRQSDEAAMAAFYSISLEAYQRGQQWAETDDNLARARSEGAELAASHRGGQIQPGAVAILTAVPFSILVIFLVFNALPAARPVDKPSN